MTRRLRTLVGLALAAQIFTAANAAEAAADSKYQLSQWHLGKVLMGPEVAIGSLAGKVVVLDYWGIHCGPCIALLPHLAKLDSKYRNKGLVIVGMESQGGAEAAIKPLITKAKIEYTITEGGDGPIAVRSLPHACVFDATGALVFDGHPGDQKFDKAITKALAGTKNVPVAPVAAGSKSAKPAANAASAAYLLPSQGWINSEGREITAAVKNADDAKATLVLPNGKEVIYPLSKLSDYSRSIIEAAVQAAK